MNNDGDLLRQFAETEDEASFAQLVQHHIGFVYAVSLRRLRDSHAAKDATQAVFIALARKARSVANSPSVVGWLHRSTCYETRNLMRAQSNRLARETEAQRLGVMSADTASPSAALDPVLDEVLCEISSTDREAIFARFFSNQSYAELGTSLGLTENAARMRVDRALIKLRDRLARRGVTSTAAALAGVLPGYASAIVPSGLTPAVTKASLLAVGSVGGTATILTFMSTAKVVTGIVVLAAVGGIVHQYQRTAELETQLAVARTETTSAAKKLEDLQRQLAALKQPPATSAQLAATKSAGDGRSSSTAAVEAPPPMPGTQVTVPKGWFKNGSANDLYEVGVDTTNSWGGMPSAYVRSVGAADGKFGGMMQTISADSFKNQRVKLTGWVKTEDANGGGHLWMRVDGENRQLQFDNMDGHAPKGTTDWHEYSVVLDVPPESTRLNYGFFVGGTGKMWVNGVTVTPVGSDVPTTNLKPPALSGSPVNLGFAPPPTS